MTGARAVGVGEALALAGTHDLPRIHRARGVREFEDFDPAGFWRRAVFFRFLKIVATKALAARGLSEELKADVLVPDARHRARVRVVPVTLVLRQGSIHVVKVSADLLQREGVVVDVVAP